MSGAPSALTGLVADCDAHGIRLLIADDGGLTIDAPQDALTPDLLARLKTHKPELLTMLRSPSVFDVNNAPGPELPDANEFYWSQIYNADRSYLLGPRNYPAPCGWCGGRLVHNPNCDELRQSWEPTITFGKHAGEQVTAIPHEYLTWLLRRDINRDLREAIRQRLKGKVAR